LITVLSGYKIIRTHIPPWVRPCF